MTGKVKTSIFGLDRLLTAFKGLASPTITDEQLGEFAAEMPAVLKGTAYPPELPNQRYIRTLDLKNSWATRRESFGRYDIINTARNPKSGRLYAGWVVGINQATIHKGRWWQAIKIVKQKAFDTFGKKMTNAILKIWGK